MLFLVTKKIAKNRIAQKICNDDNMISIFYLFIISILYCNDIMLSELFHNFSLVILQMLKPIFSFKNFFVDDLKLLLLNCKRILNAPFHISSLIFPLLI